MARHGGPLGDRFALIAPDQRGHGRSPRFSNAQLQRILPTFVADAIGVLERYGPALLLGHSLGGRVAAAAAVTRPDLVRALVLEDPALTAGTVTPPGFVAEQQRFLATFEGDGAAAEVVRMRAETGWSDAEIAAWAASKPQVDARLIARLDLGELDAAETLGALRVPTLVIWDADGPLAIPPATVSNPLVRMD